MIHDPSLSSECVLLVWREAKSAEVLAKRPKLTDKELAKLVKDLELNLQQSPFSNKTKWTLRKVYKEPGDQLPEPKPSLGAFAWQGGYGAFSVSASAINKTCEYIAGQQVHHKRQTFQDEYGAFLRKHDMEWDERFVRE